MSEWTLFLNRIGIAWAEHASAMAWQFSVVILLIAGFSGLLRRIPAAYRYGLWLLVLVKLMLPPSLALLSTPGYWLGGFVGVESSALSPVCSAVIPTESILPLGAPEFAVSAALPERATLTWQALIFLAWLMVILLLSGLLCRRTWRLRSKLRMASEVTDPRVLAVWEDCLAKMGVSRQVRLAESDYFPSPVVYGCMRTTVVLPTGLAKRSETLESVLLHELAHVCRWDVLVNGLQVLLQIFYWYHPLVWWANVRIRRERERACDDWVVSHLKAGREVYVSNLVEIAKQQPRRFSFTAGLIGMAEPAHDVVQRVRRILNIHRKVVPSMSRWSIIGLMALGLLILPWGHRTPATAEESGRPDSGSDAQENRKQISIEIMMVEVDSASLADLKEISTMEITSDEKDKIKGFTLMVLNPEEAAALKKQLQDHPNAKVHTVPKVTVMADSEALINISDENPHHYLEKSGNGLYELRQLGTGEHSGASVSVTPTITSEKTLVLDINFSKIQVVGRTPLPDAPDLQAGPPILSERSSVTRVKIVSGDTLITGGMAGKDAEGRENQTLLFVTTEIINR